MMVYSIDHAVDTLLFGFHAGLPIPVVHFPSREMVVLARHPDREMLMIGALDFSEPRLELDLPADWTREDLRVLLVLAVERPEADGPPSAIDSYEPRRLTSEDDARATAPAQ